MGSVQSSHSPRSQPKVTISSQLYSGPPRLPSLVQECSCFEPSPAFPAGSGVGLLSSPLPAKPLFSQEAPEGHQNQEIQANPQEILGHVIPEGKVWSQKSRVHAGRDPRQGEWQDASLTVHSLPSDPLLPSSSLGGRPPTHLAGILPLWLARAGPPSLQMVRKM